MVARFEMKFRKSQQYVKRCPAFREPLQPFLTETISFTTFQR